MLNPALDPAPWRARLRAEGRVQVEDFLQPEAAERLHACLAHEVPWTLALRDGAGPRTIAAADYAAMPSSEVAALLRGTAEGARDGTFRFAYDSYMMVRAYKEGRDPQLPLHRVLEFLNAPPYLQFCRALSGDERIRRVDAQATRYRPGHFLRQHTDEDAVEGRLYAYVINLSRDWTADWGGLLQFVDTNGRVTGSFLPRWNTLSLFAVPADHLVSMVMPWARHDRYAITGWWLA